MGHVALFGLAAVFSVAAVCPSVARAAAEEAVQTCNTATAIPQDGNGTALPVLSRKRRYVVFPRGTSVQLGAKDSIRIYTPLTTRFQMSISGAMAWRLPREAHQLYLEKRDTSATRATPPSYGVRHRAHLYALLQAFMSLTGLDGKACILRAICEASKSKGKRSSPRPGTFMEELHKLLFALPFHPKETTRYDEARGHLGNCDDSFSGCMSLLDLQI